MIQLSLPKLAIFDMDGLLFNTERLFMNKKARHLIERGYEAREEDYVKTIGTSGVQLDQIQKSIYGADYPGEEITERTRKDVNEHMKKFGPEIMPGIIELLEFFRANRVSCCVASSTNSETVHKYLKMANIDTYFEYVIGGDMVFRSKPDPEIFIKAFARKESQCNILKEETVIFEDSENGLRAAKAAGIPVICIPDLKYPDGSLLDIPVAIVDTAYDAVKCFNALHSLH